MVKIEVDANVQPVVTPTRKIPTAVKERFKTEIERLQNLGVIAPVDKLTPWVSSVVVATKRSGALRICIDPRLTCDQEFFLFFLRGGRKE